MHVEYEYDEKGNILSGKNSRGDAFFYKYDVNNKLYIDFECDFGDFLKQNIPDQTLLKEELINNHQFGRL